MLEKCFHSNEKSWISKNMNLSCRAYTTYSSKIFNILWIEQCPLQIQVHYMSEFKLHGFGIYLHIFGLKTASYWIQNKIPIQKFEFREYQFHRCNTHQIWGKIVHRFILSLIFFWCSWSAMESSVSSSDDVLLFMLLNKRKRFGLNLGEMIRGRWVWVTGSVFENWL